MDATESEFQICYHDLSDQRAGSSSPHLNVTNQYAIVLRDVWEPAD